MALLSVMLLYYTQLGLHESFWALLPGLLIGGVGMALTMTPTTAAAMSAGAGRQGRRRLGGAQLGRQVGGSLGIAVMGAIVAAGVSSSLRRATTPQAFLHGFHDALRVAAVLALAGAVVAVAAIRKVEHRAPAAEPRRRPKRRDRAGAKPRLPAEARRQAVLETACRAFSRSSYRGATTAEIAREAGHQRADPLPALRVEARPLPRVPRRGMADVSRPGGARHAESPETCLGAIADAYMTKKAKIRLVDLWVQALTRSPRTP